MDTLNNDQDTEHVLAFGVTGSGKSTILNHLIGYELRILKGVMNKTKLECKEQNCFRIGDTAASQTQYLEEKQIGNLILTDSPGLLDTEGIKARIDFLSQLIDFFSRVQRIKFVIVVSFEALMIERGINILPIFNRLDILVSGLQNIKNSTVLIFNKSPMEHSKQVNQEILEMIFNILKSNNKENFNSFFQHIFDKDRVFGFKQPITDQISELVNFDSREMILDSIESAESVKVSSQLQVYECLDSDSKAIIQEQKNDLIQELIKQDKQISIEIKNILLNTTKYDNLQLVLNQVEQNPIDIIKNIGTSLDQSIKALLENQQKIILELKKNLKFINEIYNSSIEYELSIQEFLKIKEIQIVILDRQYTLIIGQIITSNNIQKVIDDQTNNQSDILVTATEKFIITSNINHKGKTINIRCKQFIVTGNQTIDLQGLKGIQNTDQRQQNILDGLPGKCGGNGGNLIIRTQNQIEFENEFSSLTINISGGAGGDGQPGGNGQDGQQGQDGLIEDIMERKKSCLLERTDITGKLKQIFSLNSEYEEVYISIGKDGQRGYDGGKGGRYGIQGYHGQFKYYINDQLQEQIPNQITILREIVNGVHGTAGEPGRGGQKGRFIIGVYREEYLFPTLRGIEEKKQESNTAQKACTPLIVAGNIGVGATGITLRSLGLTTFTSLKFISGIIGLVVTGVQFVGSTLSALNNSQWEETQNPTYIPSDEYAESGTKFELEKNEDGLESPKDIVEITLKDLILRDKQVYENQLSQYPQLRESFNIFQELSQASSIIQQIP